MSLALLHFLPFHGVIWPGLRSRNHVDSFSTTSHILPILMWQLNDRPPITPPDTLVPRHPARWGRLRAPTLFATTAQPGTCRPRICERKNILRISHLIPRLVVNIIYLVLNRRHLSSVLSKYTYNGTSTTSIIHGSIVYHIVNS